MKKFGTPIGAGVGKAKLNVGLDGVGTPLLVVGGVRWAEAFGAVPWRTFRFGVEGQVRRVRRRDGFALRGGRRSGQAVLGAELGRSDVGERDGRGSVLVVVEVLDDVVLAGAPVDVVVLVDVALADVLGELVVVVVLWTAPAVLVVVDVLT